MDYRALAVEAAKRYNIPADLALRMVGQESGFNPSAVSPKGAYGLGQLMPGTAAELGVDPRDPVQNLDGSMRYLRQQYDTFGQWPLALAAYNAGPGAVQKYGGIPPFKETQNYVATITGGAAPVAAGGGQMGLLSMSTSGQPEEQPRTFGQRMKASWQDGSLLDGLALGFNSMRMNPDDSLGQMIGMRQQRKSQEKARNRTAEVLESISPEAAALVREGYMTPADALGVYRDQQAQDLARQASEALARGDTATAYALSLRIAPQAGAQAVAQQYGPRAPEVVGNGLYTVNYENGVPTVSVNSDVQAAELERMRTEAEMRREAKPPPASFITREEDDFAAIDTLDRLNEDLAVIVEDFDFDPTSGEFRGPLKDAFGASGFTSGLIGAYTGFSEGATETANARDRFNRWRSSYVNDSLQLNKGVQTEGDAQRAVEELQSAPTAEAAYKAIQDLVRINESARAIKERSIKGRRERFGYEPVAIPAPVAPKWRIVE